MVISEMNLSSPKPAVLTSENTHTFQLTQTPLVSQSVLTVGSSNDTEIGHGCLVLRQKFGPGSSPGTIISKQMHFWVQTITSAGLMPLLVLVGVPGNLLSAAVFYRLGLRERINFCIFCLAIVDLGVITVTFCTFAESKYRFYFGWSNFFIKYFVGLGGFTWVSMFLSTVIAAERCFCVVSPLRVQRMLSTRTLAVIVIPISVMLLTGKLATVGPKHTAACVFDPSTNSTSTIVYVTEYYMRNKEIVDIFDTFVYGTALPVFFFVVITITTAITTLRLQSAVKWRQQSSSAKGAQPTGSSVYHMVSLTRMLIATSVLFVVCLCPTLFLQMAIFLVPELKLGGRYHSLLDVLWTVIFVFRYVNSSCNVFVYYKMGSRFRQTLKQLLSCPS